jgi:hypothetical protein
MFNLNLGGIFDSLGDAIDKNITSDEERLTLRNQLAGFQLQAESEARKALAQVQVAETKSDSWITRSYRPIILLGMFLLIVLQCFGLLTYEVPELIYSVFGTSFGVVGGLRSGEKIISNVASGLLKRS